MRVQFYGSTIPDDQENDLRTAVKPHLNFLVGDGGINPREIKRYINTYTLLAKVMPHLNRSVVLAMQTIQFRSDWELVWRKLLAYRNVFTDAVNRQIQGDVKALENLDPELSAIPPQFLNYVNVGRPGNPLLTVDPIDEYIYAGEATRSLFAVGVSDLVRDVTNLREPLRAATGKDPTSPEVVSVKSSISQLRSKIPSLTSVPGAFSQAILRHLDELERTLDELPVDVEQREAWLNNGDRLVRRVVSDILQWSRSG